jgi:hypothetical protein
MTQRQRQSATAVSETTLRSTCVEPPLQRAAAQPGGPRSWDELFHSATPAQQAELLTLARRQGIVYASQLPAAASLNGSDGDRSRQFLTHLFHGQTADLPPLQRASIDFMDRELDDAQRDAVLKALSTPDIFLLQGLPGTGKSRVVIEIVMQALHRGQRVLLLAPGGWGADRVLEEVADRDGVLAVRCLDADERVEGLPAAVRALTVADRVRVLKQETLVQARQEADRAQERCRRSRQEESLLAQCQQLAESWRQLEAQAETLVEARRQLTDQVERAAAAAETGPEASDPFAAQVNALWRAFREADGRMNALLQDLNAQCAAKESEVAKLAPQLAALRPLVEAKQRGRWWTPAWWKATFASNVFTRQAELQARHDQEQACLAALQADISRHNDERQQADQAYRAQRRHLVEADIDRRRAALDDQEASLSNDRRLLQQKWDGACGELSADARPARPAPEAVEAALVAWRQQGDHADRQLAFARDWVTGLESLADSLPEHLAAHANLVAASSIAAVDRQFGTSGHELTFDVLVVESAHEVTESEFSGAAHRARHWVLVGEPADSGRLDHAEVPAEVRPEPRARDHKDRSPRAPAPPAARPAALPAFFERLWSRLHFDPRHLPYAWFQEKDRLCCRFRPVSAEQRARLESERVADFPEIELRILNYPAARPVLAEVVFPPAMTIAQAKEYIYRELQELSIRTAGPSLRWREEADRVLLNLSDGHIDHAEAIVLELGVRELVCSTANGSDGGWYTCCLEFDRRSGWHRQRAEEWVARHVGARDTGRTVRLDVPYRMHADLAAALSEYMFAKSYCLPKSGRSVADRTNGCAPIQFVAVPSPINEAPGSKPANGRRAAPPRPRAGRGGAGLELDLSDTRHRDRLPSELRGELPTNGLVNYLEAQAVVRSLEHLVAELAGKRNGHQSERGTSIGVLALYPAQAELIRRLVQRCPALTTLAPLIRVGVPGAFRERECDIVLLSLTRSHNHRAVTFGQHPKEIALALTRARSRIVIFGDPGTLARRAEWDGPVDHLDAASAAQEQGLIAHLVRRHLVPEQTPTRAESRPQGNRP